MSKAELESKHLAELHALAAEAGIPRFRMLPREQLVEELLVHGDAGSAPAAEKEEPEQKAEAGDRPARRRRRGRRGGGGGGGGGEGRRREPEAEEDSETEKAEEATGEEVTGVLDVLPQGHGFARLGGLEPGEEDVYVSASQIRRCELRPGDEVT